MTKRQEIEAATGLDQDILRRAVALIEQLPASVEATTIQVRLMDASRFMAANFQTEAQGGCLARSEADEPVFVLCARDPLGAITVRVWAVIAWVCRLHGDKRAEARAHASRMARWREWKLFGRVARGPAPHYPYPGTW